MGPAQAHKNLGPSTGVSAVESPLLLAPLAVAHQETERAGLCGEESGGTGESLVSEWAPRSAGA